MDGIKHRIEALERLRPRKKATGPFVIVLRDGDPDWKAEPGCTRGPLIIDCRGIKDPRKGGDDATRQASSEGTTETESS